MFVTVSDNVCLLPTVTLPKLRLVGFDPSAPGATPVPLKGTVSVGLEPSEVIVTLPLALPLVVGANVTLNVVDCEAFRVRGVLIPLS